jgi:hypothetical protein
MKMKVFKTENRKLAIYGLLVFSTLLFLQSCGNKLAPKSVSAENDFELLTQNSKNNWKEQLEFIKSSNLYVLKTNDIQLLDFGSANKINRDSLESIVAEFTNGNNYIPYQKEGSAKIIVIKFSELLTKKSPEVKIDLNIQKEYFRKIISKCSRIVKLRWKVKNNILTTNCFVSDDQGIVFDNLLTNIKVLKEGKTMKSDTVSTSRTKKQITYTIEKTWTLSHWSSTLSGKTRSSNLYWGVVYKSVEQNGSIINKEIIGLHDSGGSATILDGGQAAVGVTAGQWDNSHADFNLRYWFSVDENLTTTFRTSSEYTFGTTVKYISQETKSRIKKVTISDL